jgi:DNA-binding NtrC family response regulator
MNPQKEILEEADLSSRILAPAAGSNALESLNSASGSQDSEVPRGGATGTALTDADSDTAGDNASLRGALSRFERQHIEDVLEKNNGNVSATARALGVSRGALHRKLKDFGLR